MNSPVTTAFAPLKQQLQTVFLGADAIIDQLLVALLCSGHVLLEDVPGLGKTTLAKAVAKSVSLTFKRIQCTPDLMPSDVLGGNIYQPNTQDFKFLPGPIFTHLLLVDEINRASPRTQSAFLEAMAEGSVTIDRKTAALPKPFMVIATQNPVEFAGTFPLPEAQLDRFFMRLRLGYPSKEQALTILTNHQQQEPINTLKALVSKEQLSAWQQACLRVSVNSDVQRYIVELIEATREHKDIRLGASPRAAIALMQAARAMAYLTGRDFVTPEHVQHIAPAVLNHRLVTRGHQSAEQAEKLIVQLLRTIPVPGVAASNDDNPSLSDA
ncbi:MAG TPA: MoxR family ATPase [Marinagarivorans sp.]